MNHDNFSGCTATLSGYCKDTDYENDLHQIPYTECKSAFSTLPVAVAVVCENRIVYVNDKYHDTFRISDYDSVHFKSPLKYVARKNRVEIITMLRKYHRNAIVKEDLHTTGICEDGSEINIHVMIREWVCGEKKYQLIIVNEIEPRNEPECNYDEMLESLVEDMALGLFVFDYDKSKYVYANKEFQKMTGMSSSQLLKKKSAILDIVHEEDHNKIRTQWSRKFLRMIEFRVVDRHGNIKWFRTYRHYLKKTTKSPNLALGIVSDVTDLKSVTSNEEYYKSQLFQADKMVRLGLMMSSIVHEINNPNNFITLSIPMLKKAWSCMLPVFESHHDEFEQLQVGAMPLIEFSKKVGTLLDGIENGSQRINRIVTELKGYSKLDTRNEKKLVDLNSVIKSAVSFMEPMIKKTTKRFTCNLCENALVLSGNYQRLEQVFINLINNACDALRSTNDTITITSQAGSDMTAVITVCDTGCGISEENIKKMAKPFFTTKSATGGTGLGLSVSTTIMNEHNGSMQFTSKIDCGTTVVLRFNLEKIETCDEQDN